VQIPDVAATILEVSGTEGLEELDGRSFWPILTGKARTHRRFAAYSPKLGVDMQRLYAGATDGDWSLLFYGDGRPVELYRLRTDPLQKENVAEEHPDIVRRLLDHFLTFTRTHRASEEVLTSLSGILTESAC